MKNDDAIKDWRSTGRRRARRTLFKAYVPFKCNSCGKTTVEPPKDAPDWFDELWPKDHRVLSNFSLQAQHKTKNVQDNDEEFLEWLCASCHKLEDLATDVGVSTIEPKKWY